MCGFAALAEPGRIFASTLLDDLSADLFHRGPDSGGQSAAAGWALIFRRLAILDPRTESNQPMSDPSGRFTLVFNGEIYNFRDLRRDLEATGVRFRTSGDSEVLLNALIAWGEDALQRLEGMFAFVLIDRQEQTMLAARDPLGIKPLYMLRRKGLTGFASEMRPLTRFVAAEPDPRALAELLMFRFAAGRLSNLRHIDRIPGGHLVRVSLTSGTVTEQRYCDALAELAGPDAQIDSHTAQNLAEQALEASVTDHLQSDVGYCVQLSGGVDSSVVTALAAPQARGGLTTYGINLAPAPQDESRWRAMVTDRFPVTHHEVHLSPNDYADAFPDAVRSMEGPTAHTGCVMLMLLCREIAKQHKVVVTGEGADEFFGGYNRYARWREIQRKGRLANLVPGFAWPHLDRWREYRRFAGRDAATCATVQGDYLATFEIFPDLVPTGGLRGEQRARFADFRDRLFAIDQSAYLESLLLRQDKLAMASSLEARVPFAHMPLARLLNRLPHTARAPGNETKPILKQIAERHLPTELVRRRKIGLTIPTNDWLADPNSLGRYLELLTQPDCRLAAFGDRATLRNAVDRFRRGERYALPPLDHLIGMELWLRSLADYPHIAGTA